MIIEHIVTGRRVEVANGTIYPVTAYREVTNEPEPAPILVPTPEPKPEKKPAKKKTTKKKPAKKKATKKAKKA